MIARLFFVTSATGQKVLQFFINFCKFDIKKFTSSEIRTHEAEATELETVPFDRSGILVYRAPIICYGNRTHPFIVSMTAPV